MRRNAIEIITAYGVGPLRVFDQYGLEVKNVAWIDEEAGTFGQYVKDENDEVTTDPNNPNEPWIIVRLGRLRLEPVGG